MLKSEPRKMAAQSRLYRGEVARCRVARVFTQTATRGSVANFIESHEEDGNESQHHAGEIVTSGNLLVDEQAKHDGHKGKQSVDHGNDKSRNPREFRLWIVAVK